MSINYATIGAAFVACLLLVAGCAGNAPVELPLTPVPVSTPTPAPIPTATRQVTVKPLPTQTGDSESDDPESQAILFGKEFQNMTKDEFETWLRSREQDFSEEAIQRALSNFEKDKSVQQRWTAQWDHWENLDAFDFAISKIQEDRVVDATEASYICSVAPQWAEQMEAAQAYIRDYRQHDSELVTKTPSLYKLENDASGKSEFVAELIANCP